MNRRMVATLLLGAPWLARADSDPLQAHLRAGACALLLRHAQTVPGIGDPPGFSLGVCSSQRNLSDEGRAQARRIGKWFKARSLQPRAVRSSAWCRCQDTAELAFGRHEVWPALNSFFDGQGGEAEQTAQLRAALGRLRAGRFDVWVTHQVNMSALTGQRMTMGEGLLVNAQGKMIARIPFV
ncbi:MAG: histidine phosphatase family protein [Polaromonas sp.]|nr:histidine phosphatase family protein [Polaromonas sp.]